MPFASASMTKTSEELGSNVMFTDSANRGRIPGDHHPNFQTDCNYSHEGEHNSLPCPLDSLFPCPEGYAGWPYQYTRHDNLTIPSDVMNAAFDQYNFGKPNSGGKRVTPSYASPSRSQMVNHSRTAMSGNIGQPSQDINLGIALFNPNQGGAEPLLAIGKHDERFTAIGSGSNRESKSSAVIPKVKFTSNSERVFLPPISTYHHQLGSRSSLNPGLDMNGAGSQNDSEIILDLAQTGNHAALSDSSPGLRLGPSYTTFRRPAAGDQNYYLRQVKRDIGLGGVKDIGMEFAEAGHRNGLERGTTLPSLPFVASQTMTCDSGQSRANGWLVPPSSGMVTDKLLPELLPKTNAMFSSLPFASPPSVVTTRSIRGQDPLRNCSQSQVVGSIQQSNSPLRSHSTSDLGIQTEKGNMAAQVLRPSIMSSLKRAASQPLASTVRNQRSKTLTPQHFIYPSIPTWTRLAPSVPNTPQTHSNLVPTAQSFTPPATYPFVPPLFPSTWTTPALPPLSTTQTIPPLMHTSPFFPPNDKRVSSFHPSSHIPPLPSQQLIAQSLARQRLRVPIIPSTPNIASNYIKFKDQTPEPIGYKCYLCKRDLFYAPEGPFSQPPVPPTAAVLSCGHTFHEYCLERIIPDDQSKDPPCIPCAIRE